MHDYICSILNDAEKAIRCYLMFLEECKDSDFWPDIPFLIDNVRSSQRVCTIYYTHWPSEFNDRMLKRYRKIIAFDWRICYGRYFGFRSPAVARSIVDSLPF